MCCGCEGYLMRVLFGVSAGVIGGTYIIANMAEGPKKTLFSIGVYALPLLFICSADKRCQRSTQLSQSLTTTYNESGSSPLPRHPTPSTSG